MAILDDGKFVSVFATFNAMLMMTETALAGTPVPAPLAGAFGPVGLGVAGVAYVGYRIVKHYRNR